MSDSPSAPPKRVGIAADHEDLSRRSIWLEYCVRLTCEVVDYGDSPPKPDDDYPDFVVPLARAVARGEVGRYVAI